MPNDPSEQRLHDGQVLYSPRSPVAEVTARSVPNPKTESALEYATELLREEILARGGPGTFLGSEEEISVRIGVSRPTLRQAAAILVHEDLLELRRGQGGGFYTCLPTIEAVSHAASVYLRSKGAQIGDMARVTSLILEEAARLAALHASVAERQALADFARDAPADVATTALYVALELNRRIARMSGNEPLALFVSVMSELSYINDGSLAFEDPARRRAVHRFHLALTKAIADGEADRARSIVREYFSKLRFTPARRSSTARRTVRTG